MQNNMVGSDKKYQIFLSHKSEDYIQYGSQIYEELKDLFECWVDKEELRKYVANGYKEKIQDAILKSEIVVFIYTEGTNKSKFIIKEELLFAKENKIPILCFLVDDPTTMGDDLKAILGDIQWMYNIEDSSTITWVKESIEDAHKLHMIKGNINQLDDFKRDHFSINKLLLRIELQRYFGNVSDLVFGNLKYFDGFPESVYKDDLFKITVVPKAMFYPIPDALKDKMSEIRFLEEERSVRYNQLIERVNPEREELKNNLIGYISKYYQEIEEIKTFLENIALIVGERIIKEVTEYKRTYFNGPMLGVYDISSIIRRGEVEDHSIDMQMYYSDYFTFKFTVELFHNLYSRKNTFSNIEIGNIKKYAPFLCSLGMGGFLAIKQGDNHSLMWTRRSNSISSGDMWHFSYDETVHVLKDAVMDDKGEIIVSKDREVTIDPYKNMYRGLFEENGVHRDMLSRNKGIFGLGLIMSDRLEVEVLSYAEVIFDSGTRAIQKLKQYKDSSTDGVMEISKLKLLPIGDNKDLMGLLLTPESKSLSDVLDAKFDKLFSYEDTEKPLNGINRGRRTYIDSTAQIGEDSLIEADCEIPVGCKIGKNCKINRNVILREGVTIGDNVLIEEYSTLSTNCVIGAGCKIHRNVFIDDDVIIGNNVKIQNNVSVYHGVELADGVFVGPSAVFTNDKRPRSINDDGSIKSSADWTVSKTIVKRGASIGGGATIVCGVTIGEWAMIGAGSVVVKDVEANTTVYGNPASTKGGI